MNRTVGRWWKPSMGVARKFKFYRHHFGERKKFHLHVRQIEFFVCLFFAAFFFFFLPSHQICLSHPHSVCGFATNGCRTNAILCCYQRLLLCFFLHVLSKSWTKTNTNPNQNKQKKARFVHFSFFFWSLPPLFVVISHSCFVSFVSISKCPPPLGLWGTTHTAIWPTTTTGWEETPAETTG